MKTTFWENIPHSAKWSELREDRHKRLLCSVLHDPNTYISPYDRNCYLLYDATGEEALVYRPKSIIGRVGMLLYDAICQLFPVSDDSHISRDV